MFARKPDGSWRICCDSPGRRRQCAAGGPHIDALFDGSRGSRVFTKLELASTCNQLRVRAADCWTNSCRSQLGLFEWDAVPFGMQAARCC